MQTRIQDFDMAEGGRIDRNKRKKISFESIISLVNKNVGIRFKTQTHETPDRPRYPPESTYALTIC